MLYQIIHIMQTCCGMSQLIKHPGQNPSLTPWILSTTYFGGWEGVILVLNLFFMAQPIPIWLLCPHSTITVLLKVNDAFLVAQTVLSFISQQNLTLLITLLWNMKFYGFCDFLNSSFPSTSLSTLYFLSWIFLLLEAGSKVSSLSLLHSFSVYSHSCGFKMLHMFWQLSNLYFQFSPIIWTLNLYIHIPTSHLLPKAPPN
jgi:hypothetical protein